jgi:hypothetical protein
MCDSKCFSARRCLPSRGTQVQEHDRPLLEETSFPLVVTFYAAATVGVSERFKLLGPVSLTVRYRPLRIGWCIEANSLEHFSSAVALSNVFWGGRFNPIIPCADQELAKALIAAFSVDSLYNISGTDAVDAFIKKFPHIQWPEFHPELFVDSFSKRQPTLLDVAHPAQHLFETHVDRRAKPAIDAAFYQWDDADPLRFVLHATCGSYPPETVTGRDYARIFKKLSPRNPNSSPPRTPFPRTCSESSRRTI